MTALHIAAQYGHICAAECLLEGGADIEAKSDAIGNEWTVRTEKDRTPLITREMFLAVHRFKRRR